MYLIINEQVVAYVTSLFNNYQQPYLLYHNIEHTKYVVEKCKEIVYHYAVSETDIFILKTAAWFHDTGQLFSYGKGHEMRSVGLMKEFLLTKKIEAANVDRIEKCILATQIPHQPKSLLEEIICDADTYNLGTKDFLRTDESLRKECEIKEQKKNIHWDEDALEFLRQHRYFTSYCQSVLNNEKQNNINLLWVKVKQRTI